MAAAASLQSGEGLSAYSYISLPRLLSKLLCISQNDSSCSDGRKVRVNGNGFLNSTDLLCGLSQRANSNR